MGKLRKRRIIEILAGFIGGGWLILEFVHWILIDHYHFPEKSLDIAFVTLICALICTLVWRWFRGGKKPRRIKVELILIPLIILLTAFFDAYLFLQLREPEGMEIAQTPWKNSIAVLPFINISAEEEQEYFCDGLTEELINRLSNIKELKVPARTSSFAFKGDKIDIREVGQKLNVDKVLEGSVRKTADHIRITAQLINIADGYHLWSQKYDRNIEDIFAIQDEISLAIVNALKVKLIRGEEGRLTKHHTKDLEAYNLYLLGRWFWNKRTEEGLSKAIENFEKAIERDADFAPAHAGIADACNLLPIYALLPPNEAFPRAKKAALNALEIDETIAEAHASLGFLKMNFDWEWEVAEKEFRRAIELNPAYATGHHWYALYLMWTGRFDEAIQEIKRAHELDPLSLIINREVGRVYCSAGRYDQAVEALHKTIEMDPNFDQAHLFLGKVYLKMARYEEALEEFQKEKSTSRVFDPFAECDIGITYVRMDRKDEARRVLDNLLEQSSKDYVPPHFVAMLYFALGEKDLGFDWLEKACEDRSFGLTLLKIDPSYDGVRSDPRFQALLKKVGFISSNPAL